MADYSDIFLEAVQTIVDGTVSKLQFDKTVVCNIVNNKNAEKGEYRVSDGATTYIAYSENTTYEEGQSVYVNIPNGDYSKQKIITGKYTGESGDYYTYSSPWKKFVDITGDLIPEDSEGNSGSILANRQVQGNKSSEAYDEIELQSFLIEDGLDYDSIGLQAGFKALLSNLGASSGTYGLRLYIRTVEKNSPGSINTYKTHRVDLTIEDFNGDPYGFESYYTQQKVFDISGLGQLYSITLTLFQKNDFYNPLGQLIPHLDSDGNELLKNIFVKDVYLALGYSLDNFDGDVALLYTTDSKTYNAEYGREDRNVKNLKVRWIHKDEKNGNIVAYTKPQSLEDNAIVHWYKYRLDQNVNDELAGAFWEEIPEFKNTFEQEIDFFDYVEFQDVKYKVIIETPIKEILLKEAGLNPEVGKAKTELDEANRELQDAENMYNLDANEVTSLRYEEALNNQEKKATEYEKLTEQYSAEINYIESPVLVFENEVQVADLATLDLIQALTLEADPDGYKGIYNLYDQTNYIQNTREANILRTITANYFSTLTGDSDLDGAESIVWSIPIVNTMIEMPEDGKEFDSEFDTVEYSSDKNYLLIRRDGKEFAGTIGTSFKNATEQKFRIKKYFTENATNNTVSCYVVKNNKTYSTSFAMTFGPMGTNGTDFTFTLQMESDRVCFYGCDSEPQADVIQVNAKLYDYNNIEVPQLQGSNITYSWHSKDNIALIGFCTKEGILLDSDGNELRYSLSNPSSVLNRNVYLMDHQTLKGSGRNPDDLEGHMCCYIRRLSSVEISLLNGISESEARLLIPYYYIMKASIQIDATSETKAFQNKIILEAYCPIAYSSSYDITQMEGTTKIIYNSLGTAPYYYQDKYRLYSFDNEITDIIWDEKNEAKSLTEEKFYPDINDDGEIIPPSTYVSDLNNQVAAVAYRKIISGSGISRGEILWTQPILIMQNAYGSAMLNAWDGRLNIDEDKGTIMSTMLGAGYKDKYNRFNGVLIGDVKNTADTAADTGMFGYSEGVQSFGFKTNGTAFLGKSGKGQIQFDGNSSSIQSMSYANKQTGMKIDLDDGFIEMRGNEIQKVLNQISTESIDLVSLSSLNESELGKSVYLVKDGVKITSGEGINTLKLLISLLKRKSSLSPNDIEDEDKNLINSYLSIIKRNGDFIVTGISEIKKDEDVQQYFEDLKQKYQNSLENIKLTISNNNASINRLTNIGSIGAMDEAAELKKENKELELELKEFQNKITEIDNFLFLIEEYKKYQEYSEKKDAYEELVEKNAALESQANDYNTNFANSILRGSGGNKYENTAKSLLENQEKLSRLEAELLENQIKKDQIENRDDVVLAGADVKQQIKNNSNEISQIENQKNNYLDSIYDSVSDQMESQNEELSMLMDELNSLTSERSSLSSDKNEAFNSGDLDDPEYRDELKKEFFNLNNTLSASSSSFIFNYNQAYKNYQDAYAYLHDGYKIEIPYYISYYASGSKSLDGLIYQTQYSGNGKTYYGLKNYYEDYILGTRVEQKDRYLTPKITQYGAEIKERFLLLEQINEDLTQISDFYFNQNEDGDQSLFDFPQLYLNSTTSVFNNFKNINVQSASFSSIKNLFGESLHDISSDCQQIFNTMGADEVISKYNAIYNQINKDIQTNYLDESNPNSAASQIKSLSSQYEDIETYRKLYNDIKYKTYNNDDYYSVFYGHSNSAEVELNPQKVTKNISINGKTISGFYGLNEYLEYLYSDEYYQENVQSKLDSLDKIAEEKDQQISNKYKSIDDENIILDTLTEDKNTLERVIDYDETGYIHSIWKNLGLYMDGLIPDDFISNCQKSPSEKVTKKTTSISDLLNRYKSAITFCKSSIEKYDTDISKLENEKDSILDSEKTKIEDEYNNMIQQCEDEINKWEIIVDDFENEFNILYDTKIEYEERRVEIYEELSSYQEDSFGILFTSNNTEESSYSSNFDKYQSFQEVQERIQELDKKIAEVQQKILQKKKELGILKNSVTTEEINNYISLNFDKPIEALQNENQNLQKQLNEIYKQILTSSEFSEYESILKGISNLETNISNTKKQIQSLETLLKSSSISGKTEEAKFLKAEQEKYKKDLADIEAEKKALVKQIQEKVSGISSAKGVDDLKKSLGDKINDWIKNYNKNVSTINNLNSGIYSSDEINEYEDYLKNSDIANSIPVGLINDSFMSPEYITSRSGIKISTTSPYLTIKNNLGKSLLSIADNSYYLQSSDYDKNLKTGVNFDLLNGKINGYNFSLKSYLNESNNQYNGSFIELSSKGTLTEPYFRIHHQDNGDKDNFINLDLINISQKNFYLQSQNWISGYDGVKLDMTRGSLQAFNNFRIKATHLNADDKEKIDGMILLSSDGNPYFQIRTYSKDKTVKNKEIGETDLIKVSKTDFIIKSSGWASSGFEDTTQGLLIDLKKGNIQAKGNFKIQAESERTFDLDNPTSGSNKKTYIRSILISSGTEGKTDLPFLRITNTEKGKSAVNLLNISPTQFIMHSADWVKSKSGTEINLNKGQITSYSFKLQAINPQNKGKIVIDSTVQGVNGYPFAITYQDPKEGSKYTKITWDGCLLTNNCNITGGAKIGPFSINKNGIYIGGTDLRKASVFLGTTGLGIGQGKILLTTNGTLKVGDSLEVTQDKAIINPTKTEIKGKTTISGETTIEDTLKVKSTLTVDGDPSTFNKLVIINGDLEVHGKITGSNWGVDHKKAGTGTAGKGAALTADNIKANGGWIGKWYINPKLGTLNSSESDPKIILNPASSGGGAAIKIGKGKIWASDNYAKIEAPILWLNGTIDIYEQYQKKSGGQWSNENVKTILSGGLYADKILAATGGFNNFTASSAKFKTKDGSYKSLGALAFVDEIKKKFNIELTREDPNLYEFANTKTYYEIGYPEEVYTGAALRQGTNPDGSIYYYAEPVGKHYAYASASVTPIYVDTYTKIKSITLAVHPSPEYIFEASDSVTTDDIIISTGVFMSTEKK